MISSHREILQAPLGLSCSSRLLYRAGEGAQNTTAGPLAHSLPTSWTGPAGVELGVDTTYQHQPLIHQVSQTGTGCWWRWGRRFSEMAGKLLTVLLMLFVYRISVELGLATPRELSVLAAGWPPRLSLMR